MNAAAALTTAPISRSFFTGAAKHCSSRRASDGRGICDVRGALYSAVDEEEDFPRRRRRRGVGERQLGRGAGAGAGAGGFTIVCVSCRPSGTRRTSSPRGTGAGRCFALSSSEGGGIGVYEFLEDGAELEVRVPVPSVEEAGRQLTARYVAVDAQPTSLVVGVETVGGVRILLNASNLYAKIRPSETVWFVDDEAVVLSLRKADDEISWPNLVEDWHSLVKGVSEFLKGTSVYIVGESTEINWAVAQDIAAALGYTPLQTQRLIEQAAKVSVSELMDKEGSGSVAEFEEAVLTSLSRHVRCVVATLGGPEGAAAKFNGWNGLHGGFSVWLAQSGAWDEESAKEEAMRAREARDQAYSKSDVVVALSGWDSTAVRPTAEGSLRALKYLLTADKGLPGKKSLYVRLGCRGDWPDIKPPGWNPAGSQDQEIQAQSLAL